MVSSMNSLIFKICEVNPKMPSLPTNELQDTFQSVLEGMKKKEKKLIESG